MTQVCSEVPADFWGLTKAGVEQAIKGTGIRLTNETYEYDGTKGDFTLKDLGRWMLRGSSMKKMNAAVFWIREARRKRGIEGPAHFIILTK